MAQTTIHQLKEQDIVEMEVNGGSKGRICAVHQSAENGSGLYPSRAR